MIKINHNLGVEAKKQNPSNQDKDKYRTFRYSKHGIRRNGDPLAPEFDGLEKFEELLHSVGAVGIAAHKHAALVFFPDGDFEKMRCVGEWCQQNGAGDPWETYGNKV